MSTTIAQPTSSADIGPDGCVMCHLSDPTFESDAQWLADRAGPVGLALGRRRFLAAGDLRMAAVIDRAQQIAAAQPVA